MPSLQQTTVALSGAVIFLENKDVKPGSTRATISMRELGSSADGVFNHLSDKAGRERRAVHDLVISTSDALKEANANAKTTHAAIASADGKKAKAAAELEAARAEAAAAVAKVANLAATAHAKAASPADALEDEAASLQAKAEAARDAADTLKIEGEDSVTNATTAAADAVTKAEAFYEATLAEIEKEVRSVMGV